MFDFHLHSRFSCDSKGDPYKMAKALEEKGFSACCFTEHLDAWQELGSEVEARIPDLAAYRAAVTDLSNTYKTLRNLTIVLNL